jgi:NADPH-dependent 2,4-dienoyl-CoA reductase/sulfur reductase-like enzyme
VPRRILVIGGGPAGTYAAIAARKQDPEAAVTLLTREPCEPYEKPPLSKAVLLGTVRPEDALIAGPAGVASHGVKLETHSHCQTILRSERVVVLEDGRRLPYDALVIATGASAREIPLLPMNMPGVHYLRTEADARALKASLSPGRRLLVVGGGLIGLEVAASAAMIGVATTVLEVAPRILARVCDEHVGGVVHAAHARHGVDIRVGTSLVSATPNGAGGFTAVTAAGDQLIADVVVVGTGSKPDAALAEAAGLVINDGILVDAHCRTSDPAIFAAGDAVRFPGPDTLVRLENWKHALDQGDVAGRNAAGAGASYSTVPSFWSEQYDLYIQGVGWPVPGCTRVQRPLDGHRLLVFEMIDGRIASAVGINVQRDLAAVRRLIERRVPVDAAALADPAQPLNAMLKR